MTGETNGRVRITALAANRQTRSFDPVDAVILDEVGPQFSHIVTFVLHPCLPGDEWFGEWVVAVLECGMTVGKGDTPEEAIEKAQGKLASKTKKDLLRALKKGRAITRGYR